MVDISRTKYLAIGAILTHPRFHPIHRRLYDLTGGRGPIGRALGVDMVVVTMRGRRSGRDRRVPLAAVRDGAAWIVVGSNGGKATAPDWARNLRTHPDVLVQHRTAKTAHRARETSGEEARRQWALVVAAYPGFALYRDRTDRPIPLFALEPVTSEAS